MTRVTPHLVIVIAAETISDPRTVQKAIRGEPIRGSVGDRIARALEQRGIAPATLIVNPPSISAQG